MAKYKKGIVVFILAIFLLSAIVYASSNESNKRRSILGRLFSYPNFFLAWNKDEVTLKEQEMKRIPALMYHDISYAESGVSITPERFEEHLKWLKENGYSAISIQELVDFVKNGKGLPQKPILITFDDGYYSNYEYAFPLLQKYQMEATIFVIGSSVGHKEFYKDTEYRLTPHFSYEEALEMENSGLIAMECHTYDMHQWAPFEEGNEVRANATKLASESDASYQRAMKRDFQKFNKEFRQYLHKEAMAFAYPYGIYDELSNKVLAELGIQVTFSTEEGNNLVTQGKTEDLKCMKRYNMNDEITVEVLQEYVGR